MTVREAAKQLRLSAHYLYMLEAGDYSAIADELYLLPFARRYAQFLGLDAGLVSRQFVAGVEAGVKSDDEPEISKEVPAKQRRWPTTIAVLFFVTLAVYLVARR
jgi:cytoskeletal protein RodZ